MRSDLNSPLSGYVKNRFGGGRSFFRIGKLRGLLLLALIPLVISSYAATVTIDNGAPVEFGQGAQKATACSPSVNLSVGEDWSTEAGYFRVHTITVSNLNSNTRDSSTGIGCAGKRIRVRLITSDALYELPLLPNCSAESNLPITILQIQLPASPTDGAQPVVTPLHADGSPLSTSCPISAFPFNASGLAPNGTDQLWTYTPTTPSATSEAISLTSVLKLAGQSAYDGSNLSNDKADLVFTLPANLNLDSQFVGTATIETLPGLTS